MNGKPTYFVDKIWSGLIDRKLATIETCRRYEYNRKKLTPKEFAIIPHYKPKFTTIREDKNDRWKVGNKIDFYINCRQKNMFRFAPVLPVVSVQKITMSYLWGKVIMITIGGREMHPSEKEQFAINDGFDNWDSFFEYFYPVIKNTKDNFFKGKIIHWTDLRY
jgi:hypothetical protein